MPVTVARYSKLRQAFRLDADDIRKLVGILSPQSGNCTYTIYCNDGLARVFASAEDLLQYENPPRKEIRALQIKANSRSEIVSLDFTNHRQDSISIHLDGPEETISRINSNLEDFFPRIKPWYGVVATADFTDVFFKLFISVTIVVFLALAAGLVPVREPKPQPAPGLTIEDLRQLLLFAAFPASIFLIGYLLNRIRDRLFPIAEFAIGQGFHRNAHRERLRGGLVGGILITSLLSALGYAGSQLYSKIFG